MTISTLPDLPTNKTAGEQLPSADWNTAAQAINFLKDGATVLNAEAFGATGDGTTNDTTAIQAALDAAASSLFTRTVVLPRGVYVVTIVQVPSGVTLRGDGAVVKSLAGVTSEAIRIPATSTGASIVGVEVDGNAANQTTNIIGIGVRGGRATVRDCYVHDVKWDGISVANVAARDVIITNNRVVTTGRYGITLTSASNTDRPENVVIHGNYVQASNDGALGIVGTARHVVFSSNTTRDHGGDGIAAYATGNEDIVCVGNTFHNPGNHGIHLGGNRLVIQGNTAHNVGTGHGWFVKNHDATLAKNVVITGNVCTATLVGENIRVEGATLVAVTGNTCDAAARDAILLSDVTTFTVTGNAVTGATFKGIQGIRCQYGTISDNTLRALGGEGIILRDLATPASLTSYITVTGNVIAQTGGRSIWTLEATDYLVVDNNILKAWTTSALTLAGVNNQVGTNMSVA